MFKKFSVILLFFLLFNNIISTSINAFSNSSCTSKFIHASYYPDSHNLPLKKNLSSQKRTRFWTEENLKFLTNSQKEQLFLLQEKLIKGDKLSTDERKQIWSLRDIVIKGKLGQNKYEDFKELLLKKRGNQKLTDLEISRLKLYFEQIKGD